MQSVHPGNLDSAGSPNGFWFPARQASVEAGPSKRSKISTSDMFFGATVLYDILRMEITQKRDVFKVCAVVIHTLRGDPHYALVHVLSDNSFTVVDSAWTPGLLACKNVESLLEVVTARLMYPTSILFFRGNSASSSRSAGPTSIPPVQSESSSRKFSASVLPPDSARPSPTDASGHAVHPSTSPSSSQPALNSNDPVVYESTALSDPTADPGDLPTTSALLNSPSFFVGGYIS